MTDTLTLREISPVTHDTHRLVFDRPEGFDYRPGQAVDLALDRDGWRDERRPFTMTSLPGDDRLEFIIKSYPEHDGVTEQIGRMRPGERVIVSAPWGAITDHGPGHFIAGGAGVTPFIAILRARLEEEGTLAGSTLIFANKREKDIILREEFASMEGLETVFTLTDERVEGLQHGEPDTDFLAAYVAPDTGTCYVCGPPGMIDDVAQSLRVIGVEDERIITEDLD